MAQKKGAGGKSQDFNVADGRYSGDTDYFSGEEKGEVKEDFFEKNDKQISSKTELDELLGEEFKDLKGQVAIDKLMSEKRGHVKGAFHRDDIGDIDVFWGNDNVGLKHIIKQRFNEKSEINEATQHVDDVLKHIEETVDKGVFRKQNQRGDMEFVYNGYGVAIAPTYHNNKITYLLTAYKNKRSKNK